METAARTLPVGIDQANARRHQRPAISQHLLRAAGRPDPIYRSDTEAECILQTASNRARQQIAKQIGDADAELLPKRIIVVNDAEVLRLRAVDEERKRMNRRRASLAAAEIPTLYNDARIDFVARLPDDARVKWQNAAQRVSVLLTKPATSALLGPRGTGKTHMAAALCRSVVESDRSARWTTAADVIATIYSSYGANGKLEQVRRYWAGPYLLVLDEIQERRHTPEEALILTDLIDRRYRENRATLIIGNVELDQFEASIGASVVSRIFDGGDVVLTDWPSVRGRLLT